MEELKKYNEDYDNFQELRTLLIKNLPPKIVGFNSKEEFNIRYELTTIIQLKHKKWIEYNQDWLNFLIIDIDNKPSKGFYPTIENTIDRCLEIEFEPSIILKTDNGVQVFYTLENIVKYDDKWKNTLRLADHTKKLLTKLLNGDEKGSHRLKGIWRNPLTHEHYFSGLTYSLNDFKYLLDIEYKKNNTPQVNFTKTIKHNKIRSQIKSKKYDYKMGNRNDFLYYSSMIWSKNQDYSEREIYNFLVDLQEKKSNDNNVDKLPLKELKSTSKMVYFYNINNLNIVSVHTDKNINYGVMGFESIGINGQVSKEDFNKELKIRQKLSIKRTLEVRENNKEYKMTRVENMKRIGKEKEEKYYKMVVNVLTGLFHEEYQKKNGSWNSTAISKYLKIDRKVVSKHINKYMENLQVEK